MIRSYFPSFLLPAMLVLGALSGCGGGGDSRNAPLSLSGRNADGLSITFSQQSASISSGQGHRYTVTLRNDTSRARSFLALQDAQGFSPANFSVSDSNEREVFSFPDFETATLSTVDLEPNQVLTRTITVPASAFAQPGIYSTRAYFTNGFTGGDGPADELGPLEVRVR